MATCTYCGRDISPNARVCPHCGEPDPDTPRVSSGTIGDDLRDSLLMGLLGVIFFLGSIVILFQFMSPDWGTMRWLLAIVGGIFLAPFVWIAGVIWLFS